MRLRRVPERVLVLRDLRDFFSLKVLFNQISHHEHSVIEFPFWPLIVISLFEVINLDHDVSLRQLSGAIGPRLRQRLDKFDLYKTLKHKYVYIKLDISLELFGY